VHFLSETACALDAEFQKDETKQSAKIGERDEPGCHFKHTSNHFMSNRRNREVFLIAIVHTRTSRQLGDKLVEIKGRIACA